MMSCGLPCVVMYLQGFGKQYDGARTEWNVPGENGEQEEFWK
jgi:hypothetical protein